MDTHAKNLSMLYEGKKVSMSPFYDLVATSVYPNLSRRFAFKIGGENRPGWMQGRHWDRFAAEIGVRPQYARKIVRDMRDTVNRKLPQVSAKFTQGKLNADAAGFLAKIGQSISRAINKMKLVQEAEAKQR